MGILAFLVQILSAIASATKILEYLGIKKEHIKLGQTGDRMASERLSPRKKWVLVTAGIFLLLSIGSASYGFYLIAQRPIQTSACGMKFTQEDFIPQNSAWSSGLRVTITTDGERGPVQLLIICDGEIGVAPKEGSLAKRGKFPVESQMLMVSHPDVWNVKWRKPVWTVDDSVTFELLSERPIHVKWVFPISYNPNS